jgi:hypothetical protein
LEGCGVLVDPMDPAQIERAIRDLLSDQTRLCEMSKIARERVLSSYCWKGEGARLVDFCNQLRGVQPNAPAKDKARLAG